MRPIPISLFETIRAPRFVGYTVARVEPGVRFLVTFHDARSGVLFDAIELSDQRPDDQVIWAEPMESGHGVWVEAAGAVIGSLYVE